MKTITTYGEAPFEEGDGMVEAPGKQGFWVKREDHEQAMKERSTRHMDRVEASLDEISENTSNDKPATVRVTAGVAVGVLGGLWLYTLTVLVPLLALAMCVR